MPLGALYSKTACQWQKDPDPFTAHDSPRRQPRRLRPHWRPRPPARIRQDVPIDARTCVVAVAVARLAKLRRAVVPLAPIELAAPGATAQPIDQARSATAVATVAAGVGAARRLVGRCAVRAPLLARAIVAGPRERRPMRTRAVISAIDRRPATANRQAKHRQARGDASLNRHPDSPLQRAAADRPQAPRGGIDGAVSGSPENR